MAILVLPIIVLNFFSGIIGGVWLAFLGEWPALLLGLTLLFVGVFIVSLLLTPSLLLLGPLLSDRAAERPAVIVPIGFLSVGYTYLVMGVWAIAIFWYFARLVDPNAAIPIILWSYSTATAVWNYMAQKEQNEYGAISAFFNQVGCIALMIYTYRNFGRLDPYDMALWFAVPMIVSLIVHVLFMRAMLKAPRY